MSVSRLPPQLPPLSPQQSLASPSNWTPHHPLGEGGVPASLPSSPPRQLPDPFEHLPVASAPSLSPTAPGLSLPGLDTSSGGRSRSHSRSRVPIPILPSASSSEPIVISHPTRAHSRSVSSSTPPKPPPTSRPNGTGKAYGLPPRPSLVDKDASRPLPRVPKHTPAQLPIPDRASTPKQSRPTLPPRKSSLSSDSAPLLQPPSTPWTPQSAPPMRAPLKRHDSETLLQMKGATKPLAIPSPVPSPVPSPISAPVEKTKERERMEERLRQKRNERAKYMALRRDQPFILGLLTENHDADNSEPDTSPERPLTPPAMLSPTVPAIVRPHTPSGRHQDSSRTPSPAPFAYSSVSRSRNVEVAMTVRPPPGLLNASTDRAESPQRQAHGTGYARKWVLEKNGKRLTQDTIVVTQQLRMLR
ncbi:hypothetical protein LXA43DRAFT_432552 [Ganoderma leucocontextum]|nr:hypothetical protein LXA43DRAFT_432552 [Ganoderma leucocontextum]